MNCELSTSAKWIWAQSCLDTPNCYVYTRREFEVTNAPGAEAYVSCTGEYKLYVNGRYTGRGANYGENYNTHDVSHAIRSGKNVIAAVCHSPGREAPGGFILQLEITHNGDRALLVSTDEAWKTKSADEWDFNSSPIHTPERYQEVYDSRKKPVGWNVVGFDDSAWPDPVVTNEAGTQLPPRQIPPLREHEVHPKQVIECGTITPIDDPSLDIATRVYREPTQPGACAIKYSKAILTPTGEAAVVPAGSDSYIVLDFGAETIGYPCLKIREGGQAVVDIAYSEVLDSNGRVWPTRNSDSQADRLILHGGRQEWQAFGRRLFRYVQLTFRNVQSSISVESMSATSVGYPVEQVSTFECSDDLLNKIWRTGVYTLSLCMQDRYESSAGYSIQNAVDARLQALFNYYCFLDSALAAQALEQPIDSVVVQIDGLAWVEMLHDYYLYTGDRGLVAQLYPRLQSLVDDLLSAKCDESPADCASQYQALRTASKLAAAVSNTEDAARWHDQAAELKRIFNERISEHEDDLANVLAVLSGLTDAGKAGDPQHLLVDNLIGACEHPHNLHCVLMAMAKLDRTTEALNVIRNFWGGMLDRGATTWWDSFCPGDISEADLCFGASSAPTYFLPAEILGVKPSAAGGAVTIQPRVGDLHWAKGHIKTAAGYVDVEWRATPETPRFTIEIEAPPGFIVALPIGGFADPVIDEIDLTPETPERRARKTYGWGTTIWRAGTEHDPYMDWLATQSTEPPAGYTHRDRCAADGTYIWVRESVSNHVRYEIHEG